MAGVKEMAIKNVIEKGGEFLEIDLDENEKNEYKITLPLSYDFKFSPADVNGKGINVSSVDIKDTRTIIMVSGNASQWKLKVIKPEDRSNLDGQGTSSTVGQDEPGDRFVDWLGKSVEVDKKTKEKIHNAKREIIIRKER